MLALRAAFAIAATALVVALLLAGLPLGAVAVAMGGVFVRRSAERAWSQREVT